jgi:hypothetical protein
VCGNEYNLTRKGVMRFHAGKRRAGDWSTMCDGVGQRPTETTDDIRRRLKADIEVAKKTLQRAQQHFDKLCSELADMERTERQKATAPVGATR